MAAGTLAGTPQKEVLGMQQYDVVKLMISELESTAAQARLAREHRGLRARRPLRAVIGRRLVRFGLRLAAAQG